MSPASVNGPRSRLHGMRPAGPADTEVLALISSATFLETYAGLIPGTDILLQCRRRHSSEAFAARLANGERLFLFGVRGAPIGYLALGAPSLQQLASDFDERSLEIADLYVLNGSQGNGIGSCLLMNAVVFSIRAGVRRLIVKVDKRNDAAIGFFEAQDFRPLGLEKIALGGIVYDQVVLARAIILEDAPDKLGQFRALASGPGPEMRRLTKPRVRRR